MRIKTSRIPRSTKPKEGTGAKLEITYVDAASLIPYAKNARTHSEVQIELIRRSLLEFGWTNPVLLDGKKGVIAGHGRLLAAAKIWEAGGEIVRCPKGKAPCIDVHGLTAAQKRAYILADNQLAVTAGWDADLLAAELGDLKFEGFDLSLIGFDDRELVQFMAAPGGLSDPDEVPPDPVVPVSRAGDLWLLSKHRLLCGDSTKAEDVARLMGGAKPFLMITDPPYGVDYDPTWRRNIRGTFADVKQDGLVTNDGRADWSDVWQLSPATVAYVWHGALHAGVVSSNLEKAGFAIRSQIIWSKQMAPMTRGHYRWQHEPCWYAAKGSSKWCGDVNATTIWEIKNLSRVGGGGYESGDEKVGHGTQKPVECMARPIRNHGGVGDDVYDPFLGSGTTIIAAEMTGRACYALEIAPQYVDVSVLRWQQFTGKEAVLDADGRTFAEVSAERLAVEERVAA